MPETTIYRILIDDELKSDNAGPIAWAEAIVSITHDPSMSGKKLTVMVKRGSEVIGEETVTL